MNELQLVKSEHFGDVEADIYSSGEEMFMTANQLCACLQESRETFDSRISRNPYLKNPEFSVSCKLQGGDGKQYETRIYSEDGIYETTMLSKSEKAKEFRAWVRGVLKSIRRTSGYSALATDKSLDRQQRSKAMLLNAKYRMMREAKKLYDIAGIKPEYQILALQDFYGEDGPRLPAKALESTNVTYDKGAIAKQLGVYSEAGIPHAHAIGAIIKTLDIEPEEMEKVPYIHNGHDGFDIQYTESVINKVRNWLGKYGCQSPVLANGKNYRIIYRNPK